MDKIIIEAIGIVAFATTAIAILSGFKQFAETRQVLNYYYQLLNSATSFLAVILGISTGVIASPYKPVLDLSSPQLLSVVFDVVEAIPSNAIPSNAIPSNAIPSNYIPSNARAIPSNYIPPNAIPAEAIPAEALPASALPASALPASALPASALPASAIPAEIAASGKFQRLPDLGQEVCGSGRCDENTKYSYYSDQPNPQVSDISVEVEIWADAYSLTVGECTKVHWLSVAAQKIWLDSDAVEANGVREVCPKESTSYGINASGPDGSKVGSSLTIHVSVPEQKPEGAGVELAGPDRCALFDSLYPHK